MMNSLRTGKWMKKWPSRNSWFSHENSMVDLSIVLGNSLPEGICNCNILMALLYVVSLPTNRTFFPVQATNYFIRIVGRLVTSPAFAGQSRWSNSFFIPCDHVGKRASDQVLPYVAIQIRRVPGCWLIASPEIQEYWIKLDQVLSWPVTAVKGGTLWGCSGCSMCRWMLSRSQGPKICRKKCWFPYSRHVASYRFL